MKTLAETIMNSSIYINIVKKYDSPSLKVGNIIFENMDHLESLINEVISQRSGEPVATVKVFNQGGSGQFKAIEGLDKLEDGAKLYLAADPSVIEYVKTLRSNLETMIDEAQDNASHFHESMKGYKLDEHKEKDENLAIARSVIAFPPDSIKHLLD